MSYESILKAEQQKFEEEAIRILMEGKKDLEEKIIEETLLNLKSRGYSQVKLVPLDNPVPCMSHDTFYLRYDPEINTLSVNQLQGICNKKLLNEYKLTVASLKER